MANSSWFSKVSSVARDPYNTDEDFRVSSWDLRSRKCKVDCNAARFDTRVEIPRSASGFQKEPVANCSL